MRKTAFTIIICILMSGSFMATGFGGDKNHKLGTPASTTGIAGVSWAKHALQGFGMNVWVSNQMVMGIEAWSPASPPSDGCGFDGIGLKYPLGSCVEHLYGGGPLIGELVDGTPHPVPIPKLPKYFS